MSLESRILTLVGAIGADIKALFAGKQTTLVSGNNIKTINESSIVGSGNLAVGDVTLDGVQTLTNKVLTNPSLNNSSLAGIKTATFSVQQVIVSTSGSIVLDWSAAQNKYQSEPTGAITYSFTAPVGPCHLQLLIASDGVSTAQAFTWPASVKWIGAAWVGAVNKAAVINFWFDGTSYWAMGSNQV